MSKIKLFDPDIKDQIQSNVYIPWFHTSKKQRSDIMHVEVYREGVESNFLMNYDGWGDAFDEEFNFIETIYPSDIDDLASDVVWVIWYNK